MLMDSPWQHGPSSDRRNTSLKQSALSCAFLFSHRPWLLTWPGAPPPLSSKGWSPDDLCYRTQVLQHTVFFAVERLDLQPGRCHADHLLR